MSLLTIGEAANILSVEQYVLRFWETQFPQIKPQKKNGRRLYTPANIETLKLIKDLLYCQGYKIKAVQQKLSETALEESTKVQEINSSLLNKLQQIYQQLIKLKELIS